VERREEGPDSFLLHMLMLPFFFMTAIFQSVSLVYLCRSSMFVSLLRICASRYFALLHSLHSLNYNIPTQQIVVALNFALEVLR
jgi:hypothetical protein